MQIVSTLCDSGFLIPRGFVTEPGDVASVGVARIPRRFSIRPTSCLTNAMGVRWSRLHADPKVIWVRDRSSLVVARQHSASMIVVLAVHLLSWLSTADLDRPVPEVGAWLGVTWV